MPAGVEGVDYVVDNGSGTKIGLNSNFMNLLSGIGDFFDGLFGGSHMTNETNLHMNQQNIAYQMMENEITREREDNAVQRAASDMTAAGLSKTLAAGNPASAQALDAPNNSFSMEKNLAGLNAIKFLKELHFEDEANKRANDLNAAQVGLINAQAGAQNFSNSVQEETWQNEQDYKKAMTSQANSSVSLNRANTTIARITGDNLQKQIDSDIAFKTAETVESYSRTELNNINKQKADKEIAKISWEIYNEYLNSGYIKAKTDTEKQQLQLAIQSATKAYYETQVLMHNINYAQKMDLPVGVIPNGVAGSVLNTGNSLYSLFRNFYNANYNGGVGFKVVPAFGFDGSASMQNMPVENAGGGYAW